MTHLPSSRVLVSSSCPRCGREDVRTPKVWKTLKLVGVWVLEIGEHEREVRESRNCTCGSTLTREVVSTLDGALRATGLVAFAKLAQLVRDAQTISELVDLVRDLQFQLTCARRDLAAVERANAEAAEQSGTFRALVQHTVVQRIDGRDVPTLLLSCEDDEPIPSEVEGSEVLVRYGKRQG